MLCSQCFGKFVLTAIVSSVIVIGRLRRRVRVSASSLESGRVQDFMQFCTLRQEIFLVKGEKSLDTAPALWQSDFRVTAPGHR